MIGFTLSEFLNQHSLPFFLTPSPVKLYLPAAGGRDRGVYIKSNEMSVLGKSPRSQNQNFHRAEARLLQSSE